MMYRVKKFKTGKLVSLNIKRYLIKWDRKVSGPQKAVKDFLYPYWKYHLVVEEFRIPGSLLRCDLLNLTKKISVEISPESVHGSFNKFFHRSRSGFLASIVRDVKKQEWLTENGFECINLCEEGIEKLSYEFIQKEFGVSI